MFLLKKKLSSVPSGESAAADFEEVVKEKERWWEGREKRWEGKNEDGEKDKNYLGVGLFE